MRSFRDSIHESRQFTCSLAHSLKGYCSQKWPNISCLSATNIQTSKILSCCLSWPWLCVGDSWSVRDTVYTYAQMATAGFTGKFLWNMNRLTPLPEPSPPSSLSRMHSWWEEIKYNSEPKSATSSAKSSEKEIVVSLNQESAKFLLFK